MFKIIYQLKNFIMGIFVCVISTASFAIPIENFYLTVQNNYAYTALRTFLMPDTSCFSQLPSAELPPGSKALYTYIPGLCGLGATQKKATGSSYYGPTVIYELQNDPSTRGCQFYFGSSAPGLCDAPNPTQTANSKAYLACTKCQATYNSTDNSCTYTFAIGSTSCATSMKK